MVSMRRSTHRPRSIAMSCGTQGRAASHPEVGEARTLTLAAGHDDLAAAVDHPHIMPGERPKEAELGDIDEEPDHAQPAERPPHQEIVGHSVGGAKKPAPEHAAKRCLECWMGGKPASLAQPLGAG